MPPGLCRHYVDGCTPYSLRNQGNASRRVAEIATNRYGRIVGRVYVDRIDVNRELVAQCYAWVYRKYSNDAELLRLEAKAKARSE